MAYGMIWSLGVLYIGRLLPKLEMPKKDMTGRNIIITGANAGIGFVIAKELAGMGANVYMACRNTERGTKALNEIKKVHSKANVTLLKLDTGSLESCKQFAKEWNESGRTIDQLIHNAGIASPDSMEERFSPDGFEWVYQTNFLSNYLLTRLLEEKLAPDARVLFNSSAGSYGGGLAASGWSLDKTTNKIEPGYHLAKGARFSSDSACYGQSKLLQVCLARALQDRWSKPANSSSPMQVESTTERIAAAFTPGYTKSNILQKTEFKWSDPAFGILIWAANLMATETEQGAITGIWCSVSDKKELGGNLFFDRNTPLTNPAELLSQETMDRLWIRWSRDAGLDP